MLLPSLVAPELMVHVRLIVLVHVVVHLLPLLNVELVVLLSVKKYFYSSDDPTCTYVIVT